MMMWAWAVMRLQRPHFGPAGHQELLAATAGATGPRLLAQTGSLERASVLADSGYMLDATPVTPGLPRGFGTIFAGQTFRCAVLAINHGPDVLRNAVLSAELQLGDTGPSTRKVDLTDIRTGEPLARLSSLAPSASVDLVLRYRIPTAMACSLRVNIGYNDAEGRPRTFRKFYKFVVADPLTITPVLSVPLAPDALRRAAAHPSTLAGVNPLTPSDEAAGSSFEATLPDGPLVAPVLLRMTLENKTGASLTVARVQFRPASCLRVHGFTGLPRTMSGSVVPPTRLEHDSLLAIIAGDDAARDADDAISDDDDDDDHEASTTLRPGRTGDSRGRFGPVTLESLEQLGVGVLLDSQGLMGGTAGVLPPDLMAGPGSARCGVLVVHWRGPGGESGVWASPTVLAPLRHVAPDDLVAAGSTIPPPALVRAAVLGLRVTHGPEDQPGLRKSSEGRVHLRVEVTRSVSQSASASTDPTEGGGAIESAGDAGTGTVDVGVDDADSTTVYLLPATQAPVHRPAGQAVQGHALVLVPGPVVLKGEWSMGGRRRFVGEAELRVTPVAGGAWPLSIGEWVRVRVGESMEARLESDVTQVMIIS